MTFEKPIEVKPIEFNQSVVAMENFAKAFSDYEGSQRVLEDRLYKQESVWQEHRDRVSNLPPEIAHDARTEILGALESGKPLGQVHRRIREALDRAEDAHWKKCVEWLLAERDWKEAARPWSQRVDITVGDVTGFSAQRAADDARRINQFLGRI